MSNLNIELVKKELFKLNLARFLIISLTLVTIAGLIYCIKYEPSWSKLLGEIGAFYFLIFIFSYGYYLDYVLETAYILLTRNFGFEIEKKMEDFPSKKEYKAATKEYEIEKAIFSGVAFRLGLFMRLWNIEYDNYLKGTRDNYKFTIQDFTLGFTRRRRDARYKQLTIDTPFSIKCDIIIRKNRLIKWNLISRLKQMKIQNREFEKCYETFTNNFEEAQKLLNEDFIFELLKYNKIYGRHIEVIITPKKIFLLNEISVWDLIFRQSWNWNIFASPKKQINKIWADIDNFLNVLPVVSLLGTKE